MPFSPANTYASLEELKLRVSRHGYKWAADVDDGDGFVPEGSPEQNYPEEALEYANTLIDEALVSQNLDITPRQSNDWCKDRAIDIAAARIFSLGGRNIPAPLQAAFDLALDKLMEVRAGTLRIPGMDYSNVTTGGRRSGLPVRMINLRRCR